MLHGVRHVSHHGARRRNSHVVPTRGKRLGHRLGELLSTHVDERIREHLAVAICKCTCKKTADARVREFNVHASGTRSPALFNIDLKA